MNVKRIVLSLLPPILTQWLVRCKQSYRGSPGPFLEYVPEGWDALETISDANGWDVNSVVNAEEAKWKTFSNNCQSAGPLGFSHENPDQTVTRNISFHNIHITYAYVLALTAHKKTSISVLDWGGGLGHYYLIGKAVLPDVKLDFHCKEVPRMVEAGKRLNPEVHWYADESCFEQSYDLVMINGSLQYVRDWPETLRRLARIAKEYLFLTRLPVVDKGPSFVAIQRVHETEIMHQQINQEEILRVAWSLGLHLVREFVVGDRPYIQGAPEQCELRGWLFKCGESVN